MTAQQVKRLNELQENLKFSHADMLVDGRGYRLRLISRRLRDKLEEVLKEERLLLQEEIDAL